MSSVIISGDTSGAITLSAPAVAGTNTITLPAATGTVMVTGNIPVFSAYLNTPQTLSSSTFTKITLNAEEYDTANAFDSTTNYRFTPQVAGYYQFNAQLTVASSLTPQVIALYKNGTSYIRLENLALSTECIAGSWLIYLNGSTDYIEMYGFVVTGQALNTGLNVQRTNLQGFLVRTA